MPLFSYSDDQLGALLRKVGVPDKMARHVREKARGHHYQVSTRHKGQGTLRLSHSMHTPQDGTSPLDGGSDLQ